MLIDEGGELRGPAKLGGQPTGIDVSCFQQEPHRIGPAGGKAALRKRPAAAVAELGAERVVRVLDRAVEQMFRPYPGLAAAVGDPGAMT